MEGERRKKGEREGRGACVGETLEEDIHM